jgi:hypothetical protein
MEFKETHGYQTWITMDFNRTAVASMSSLATSAASDATTRPSAAATPREERNRSDTATPPRSYVAAKPFAPCIARGLEGGR